MKRAMRKTVDQVVEIGSEVIGIRDYPLPTVTCRIRLFIPEQIGRRQQIENAPFAVSDRLPPLPILVLCWTVGEGTLAPGWLESYVGLLQIGIAGLSFPVTLIERFRGQAATVRRVFFGSMSDGKTIATFQSISPDAVEEVIGETLEAKDSREDIGNSVGWDHWGMGSEGTIAISGKHGPCYPNDMIPSNGIGSLGEAIHKIAITQGKQKKSAAILDEQMEYVGYHGNGNHYQGCQSICRVRVFDPNATVERGKRPLVVIFTDLSSNTGTSVTNRIEHLATILYNRLGKPEREPVWIEHYEPRGVYNKVRDRWQFPEDFDFVELRRGADGVFHAPVWKPTNRMTVEVIIGQQMNN